MSHHQRFRASKKRKKERKKEFIFLFFQPNQESGEYERNLRDWLNLKNEAGFLKNPNKGDGNILLLLLEEVLAQPERIIKKMHTFLELGEELSTEKLEKILKHTTGNSLVSLNTGK